MKRARAYDNRRRAARAAGTRARIVEAALALLAEDVEALTVPAIAARAGVSVPTVYRNFAARDALLEAVDAALVERLGPPATAETPEALPGLARTLHARFGANVALVRTAIRRPAFGEVRGAGLRSRDRALARVVAPLTAGLPAEEARAFGALLRLLMGSEAFLALHDRFGLPPEISGRATAWAVAQLCRAAAGLTSLEPP